MTNLTDENKTTLSNMSKDLIIKSIKLINEKTKEIKVLSPCKEQEEIFNVIDENLNKIKSNLDKIKNLEFPQ